MKTRIITALIAIAGIFPFFWFSAPVKTSLALNYLFPAMIAIVAFVSIYELLRCVGFDKNYVLAVPLYLAALFFPIFARAQYRNMQHSDYETLIRAGVLAILAFGVYFFSVLVFTYGKAESNEEEQRKSGRIALVYMTSVYIIGAYTAIIVLRDTNPRIAGRFVYLIPFLFAWVTDTFAYFTGRLFGKHKLIPAVSPKKTVEGAIGGAVCCALVAVLYGFLTNLWFDARPNYIVLAIAGLVIAVVSQVGDLAMSAIKRQYGIKDYGKLLPGHGGLLDRFDSCMAVAVVVALINAYFPFFG